MKKLTLALVAAMSLSTAAFAAEITAPSMSGSDGQIKFIGRVVANGCTIETGNNGTINLGTISKAVLKERGFSNWTDAPIRFLQCNLQDDGKTTGKPGEQGYISGVELTILSGDAAKNPLYWANQGTAEGVAVNVKISGDELSGQPVLPVGTTKPIPAAVHPANDEAIYIVQGQMVLDGDKDKVTAGSVEATLYFQASYK